MSEKNASYGSDFSRVFRHELASIRDRRRSQRIESLQQLSEAGDYSRRAVKWAINAAKQEADMAKKAADAAEEAARLTKAAESKARADGQELIKRAEQLLREAAPIREPSEPATGTPEAVQERAEASRTAKEQAGRASSEAAELGKKIIKAATINTVTERVTSIRAMMGILEAATDTAQEVMAAEAIEAAKATYDALDRILKRIRHEDAGPIPQAIQDLHDGLQRFRDEIPPTHSDLPAVEFGAIRQKLEEAEKTCETACGAIFAELSDELKKEKPGDLLVKQVPELSDEAKKELAQGHVERVKPIVQEAIAQLGKRAIEAAGWAWRAEQEAAKALYEAAAVLKPSADPPKTSGQADASQPALTAAPLPEQPALEHLREHAVNLELAGLAFSGGGIRSATFNLGVLQALGKLRLLRFFDYLSTVSGGGYIGGWLAAWVHRERSLTNVEKQLDPSRDTQADAKRIVKKFEEKINNPPPDEPRNPSYGLQRMAIDEEPEPIRHLRAYSRYLTPRPGIFSADTWAFFAIYLRNLLINLAVLLPWILVVVLPSRLLIWLFSIDESLLGDVDNRVATVFFFLTAVPLGFWLYGQRQRVNEAAAFPNEHPEGADHVSVRAGVWLLCGVLLMTITVLWRFSLCPNPTAQQASPRTFSIPIPSRIAGWMPSWDKWMPSWDNLTSSFKLVFLCALGTAILSLAFSISLRIWARMQRRKRPSRRWKDLGICLFCDLVFGFGIGLSLILVLRELIWPLETRTEAIVTFGVPVLLLALILGDYAEMLFVGKLMDELEREWRSRLGAVLFMLAAGWLVFFGATIYLPMGLNRLGHWIESRAAVFWTAAGAWGMLSTLAGWAGRWLQAGAATRRSLPWLRLLIALGPPLFLIGLLAAVALLIPLLPPAIPSQNPTLKRWAASLSNFLTGPNNPFQAEWCEGIKYVGYFLFAWGLILWFYFTVDVNRNSMHMFYANRLIRCYLGASRRKRQWRRHVFGPIGSYWLWETGDGGAPTNADTEGDRIARREPTFSGFDPADDMWLQELAAVGPDDPPNAAAVPAQPNEKYRGPYPLFNTTLNLVAGSELAHQDRKADSFLLTPDFCGSKATGYARLPQTKEEFSDKGHLTLGRAMTISGAAVDPNMGVGQSPPLTALMTVLNTRLGWWLQNPACWGNRWEGSGPTAGALLIRELFGLTDAKSKYVHLSDGGHFENLGVYELIRRRCRFIVVTDVTPDHHAASDNLGNLLRLIRTDFGIRIDLDTGALTEGADGSTRWHCAIGLIHYEDVDPQSLSGLLIYLRASLSGDEPPDVRQYADTCPPFPHQSTLDQFYSEGQLESYRALGYHVAWEVFAASAKTMNRDGCDPQTVQAEVRDFFARVRRRWFPSPPGSDQNFPKSAQLYLDVDKKLRTEERLQHLGRELYPELRGASAPIAQQPLFAPPVGRAAPPPIGANADAGPEFFMTAEMLQMMEMVWFDMKLDDYYAHPLNRGWMNIFRRWTNSATFHGYWPLLRSEFSQDFGLFCERALNMLPIKSDCEQLKRADGGKWLADLKEMDQEFKNEWDPERDRLPWLPTGRYLRDAAANASAFADRFNPKIDPMVWRLSFKFGMNGTQRRTCGLICAGPAFRGAAEQLELIVWLRGPYRSLGIGRHRFGEILSKIGEELRGKPARNGLPFRLYVYYPDAGVNRAERLEQLMWRNFFFDYEFRAVKETDAGSLAGVITLARELG